MKFRNLITVVAFAIIFAFVFLFSALVFNKIFVQPDQEFLLQGVSAFMGAFFAFLFLRLADFLTKVYKRQVRHYNSLVILETQLNEIGGIIHDNLYLLPNFIKTITSGNIYFNNLREIPIDKSHYKDLYDLDLLNELFAYNYDLRKINDDIETATLGYQDIKNALIQRHVTPQNYKVNAEILAKNLQLIEIFLKELKDKTVRLLARVRLQIKGDIPLGTKLQRFFMHTVGPKIKQEDLDKEIKKLKSEIEETKIRSQKEIEEILKKYRTTPKDGKGGE